MTLRNWVAYFITDHPGCMYYITFSRPILWNGDRKGIPTCQSPAQTIHKSFMDKIGVGVTCEGLAGKHKLKSKVIILIAAIIVKTNT